MQRTLVILVVILLVAASLGVGTLAANWPFWRRAWAWHAAEGGWPSALPGPAAMLRGGSAPPLRFLAPAADLRQVATASATSALLRIVGDEADAWFAPDFDADTLVDGRGLTPLVLLALYASNDAGSRLRDGAAGMWLHEWQQDQRGALTPSLLLARIAQGIDAPPAQTPLNPFAADARLASGPDFHDAALSASGPGGTAHPAAAAQLLASIAARAHASPFHELLQQQLWSRLAARDAWLMLDRRRGDAAAHCCLRAAAADWLRLGRMLGTARVGAADQPVAQAAGLATTPGRALAWNAFGAVLWVGTGAPPSRLENLLPSPTAADGMNIPVPSTSSPMQ